MVQYVESSRVVRDYRRMIIGEVIFGIGLVLLLTAQPPLPTPNLVAVVVGISFLIVYGIQYFVKGYNGRTEVRKLYIKTEKASKK